MPHEGSPSRWLPIGHAPDSTDSIVRPLRTLSEKAGAGAPQVEVAYVLADGVGFCEQCVDDRRVLASQISAFADVDGIRGSGVFQTDYGLADDDGRVHLVLDGIDFRKQAD